MPEVFGHRLGQSLTGALANAECRRDCIRNQLGALDRRQIYEYNAVVVLGRGRGGHRDAETRLPTTARARQRDETVIRQRRDDVVDLPFATDEARRSTRKVDAGLRAHRWRKVVSERGMGQLEQTLRPSQVAQPVLAEIAQPGAGRQGIRDERGGGFGDKDLPALRKTPHSRRSIHCRSVVVGVA